MNGPGSGALRRERGDLALTGGGCEARFGLAARRKAEVPRLKA
jgi:hypothetical protein